MSEADPPRKRSKRTAVLGAITLGAVVALVASDDGSIPRLARCMVGDGAGLAKLDGPPFTVDYFGYRYSGSMDNLIDVSVAAIGSWELPVLAAMRDGLLTKAPNNTGVVVDVGANVGTHSFYISAHAKTVHAIEPWPPVYDRMRASIASNPNANVVLHPVGFADEPGTLPYHVPAAENLGQGSFSGDFVHTRETIDLPLVVADQYLAEHQIDRVDLIKIDIEGYERPALEGFLVTMRRDRPLVFMELNVANEEGFHSETELRSVFPDNYSFFDVARRVDFTWNLPGNRLAFCHDPNGGYRLVPFDMSFTEMRNIVAIPDELVVQVLANAN